MLVFKSCPHCGGDLIVDAGGNAPVAQCLQCSREFPFNQETARPVERTRPTGLIGRRGRPRNEQVA